MIFGYCAFALAVIVINFLVIKAIGTDKKTYRKYVKAASKEGPAQIKKRKNPLVPVDPKKYGMMVVANVNLPKNQQHADLFAKKIIDDSGVLSQEKVAVELKAMNITPEEYKERSQIIDGRITFYEENKNSDPGNKEIEENLQRLYLLKSIQSTFIEKAALQKTESIIVPAPSTDALTTTDVLPEATPATGDEKPTDTTTPTAPQEQPVLPKP